MRYVLSWRQRKELENGKVLRIAIPYPDHGIPGAHRHHDGRGRIDRERVLDWLADTLDTRGVDWDCIDEVEIVDVPVNPLQRGAGGLASILGEITGRATPRLWLVRIVCVVVTLCATSRRATRGHYPTQW